MAWEPKLEGSARIKANEVAKFMKWYKKHLDRYPPTKQIAARFKRSLTWASTYRRLAYKYGFIE